MSTWLSYGISDLLMFAPHTWYRLLELHNRAWWPLQAVAMVPGVWLLWAIHRRLRSCLPVGLVLMGASLLFVAWFFHWQRFAAIQLAAPWFAWGFAGQGLLLLAFARWRRRDLVLGPSNPAAGAGVALLVLAVPLYPALSLAWLRPLEQSEWFALAPDPTMLATLGLLLLLWRCERLRRPGLAWALLSALPLAWCAVTGATLWALAAPDWWQMPLAGSIAALAGAWQASRPRSVGAAR